MEPPRGIGFEIKSLSNLIKRCLFESNEQMDGITGMQGWIIGYVYDHGKRQDIFQRDIENVFKIRRSTATGILQLMEKSGLITREQVESDARLKKLVLTSKAVTIHENIMKRIEEMERKLRSGLTEEEIASFLTIIHKIKKNIE